MHDGTNTELVCPLSLVEITQNVLHIGYLFTDTGPIGREVDEKLIVRVLVVDIVESHHAVILVTCATASILIAAAQSLFLWHHSLLQLVQNRI